MHRRSFLAGTAALTGLAMPRIARAAASHTLTFVPDADLASLDPVWTTSYQTLEQARRLRAGACRGDRRNDRQGRPQLRNPAQAPFSAAARRAEQDLSEHVPDHARASRADRRVHAGDRSHRQWPVPLCRERTGARLAGGLSAVRWLRAAHERQDRADERAEDRRFRPDRMGDHARYVDGRDRAATSCSRRSTTLRYGGPCWGRSPRPTT
jgi:hypothetical protein